MVKNNYKEFVSNVTNEFGGSHSYGFSKLDSAKSHYGSLISDQVSLKIPIIGWSVGKSACLRVFIIPNIYKPVHSVLLSDHESPFSSGVGVFFFGSEQRQIQIRSAYWKINIQKSGNWPGLTWIPEKMTFIRRFPRALRIN